MTNPYQSSGDSGSGDVLTGVNLEAHVTGNPIASGSRGAVTVGHTWAIIVIALAALWLLAYGFRTIRMG